MKKKWITVLATLFTCATLALGFTACGSGNNSESSDNMNTEQGTSEISFKTLSVDGTNVYGKVSNATETFSFIDEVTVVGTAKFVVSLDILGVQQVATKTIPLEIGDNTVYVTEMIDDDPVNVYTVTVRRRPMYYVSFNTNGGSSVQSQTIEEDSLASVPTQPIRAGYDFTEWDYDFATPITKSTIITARWIAHTNTQYKVEYYLQNLENDNYTLKETVNKTGTTGATATAEIKNYEHFTYNASKSVVSRTIDGDGSTVLKVYYTRDKYTVTFKGNGGTLVSGKETQTVKYEGSVIAPTYERTGYTLTGFDKALTDIEGNTTISAQWAINQYTLTIVYGNGQADNVIAQDYGSIITETLPDNLEREYYEFIGWDKTIPMTMPAENTTVTAQWKSIFTVSENSITGLTSYGRENCVGLYIPSEIDGVVITSIGFSAFRNHKNLTSVEIPDSVTSIGSSAFCDCSSLTSVVIGDSVTSIGNYAFNGCSSLTSVVIGDGVMGIDDYAFEGCTSLTRVYITDIAAWCNISFGNYNCNPLCYAENLYLNNDLVTELVIPDSVTSIGNYAFNGCSSLISVVIPDSVTSIGNYAFNGCSSLTSVVIPNSVESIGSWAFGYCSDLTSIEISDSITSIGNYAFWYCSSLTSVVIPNRVKSIGSYAFYNCSSLTSVAIPNSVTFIGDDAFDYCSSLTSVHITDMEAWCNISFYSSWGFSGTNPLYYANNLYLNNELVTTLVIPDTVTSIGDYVFENCDSVTSVVIPDSVTSIGFNAFDGCRSLTNVYYKGTVSEWSAISIDSDNTPLTNRTRYYYIENEADVPTDGGNYWHYNENGEVVVW